MAKKGRKVSYNNPHSGSTAQEKLRAKLKKKQGKISNPTEDKRGKELIKHLQDKQPEFAGKNDILKKIAATISLHASKEWATNTKQVLEEFEFVLDYIRLNCGEAPINASISATIELYSKIPSDQFLKECARNPDSLGEIYRLAMKFDTFKLLIRDGYCNKDLTLKKDITIETIMSEKYQLNSLLQMIIEAEFPESWCRSGRNTIQELQYIIEQFSVEGVEPVEAKTFGIILNKELIIKRIEELCDNEQIVFANGKTISNFLGAPSEDPDVV